MSSDTTIDVRQPDVPSTWPSRALPWVRLLCAPAVLLSLAATLGAVTGLQPLVQPRDAYPSMSLFGAVGFLAMAVAVGAESARLRRGLAAPLLVLSLLLAVPDAVGVGLDLRGLVRDNLVRGESITGGPYARTTAIAVALLSLAILFRREQERRVWTQLVLTVPLAIGLVAGYGYLFEASSLYESDHASAVAPQSAACLALLSLAALLSEPRGAVQWVAFGRDPGAALQRVLVPVTLGVLPLSAYVLARSEEAGLISSALAYALLVLLTVAIILTVGLRSGRVARLIDDDRERLLHELTFSNRELEERVRTKAHQLNRQRTKLVLLEERDRIARDLHDRIVQRIFAAGLQVASLSRAQAKKAAAEHQPEPVLVETLDLLAGELDLAIRELRNSIFELTSIDDHEDVEQIVHDIASRASRILGFMPRVVVHGDTGGLQPDLVAQLASVIQEALSNVARHAGASSVEVAVTAGPADLTLTITDDGKGLPDPLPRSSGISNLMNRARNLGGTATWANAAPRGTVVTWWVPRALPAGDDYGNDTPVARSDSDHSAAAASSS